ncbi:MAG: SMI1/KNR4 family protein [Armatimonadetes bacterium]|nr:SMI1/KNR4 family protein [Armatimonadota bacterium]
MKFLLSSQGPTISNDLVVKFEREFQVKLPIALIEFWKTYGNGGFPDGHPCKVPIPASYSDEEYSLVHGVYGVYHLTDYFSLGLATTIFPTSLDVLPFAYDEGTGTFVVSTSDLDNGRVYHLWLDELEGMTREKLTYIAESPLEMIDKYLIQLWPAPEERNHIDPAI